MAAAAMAGDTTTDIGHESQSTSEGTAATEVEVVEAAVIDDEPEDPIVAQLKRRVASMVDKIEVQLSETQIKIGDKMHLLDKDRDGILTREEVAEVLEQVFKKNMTFDEAMDIANEMVRMISVAKIGGSVGA